MGAGNERDRLQYEAEMATRDLDAAEAAVHPSEIPTDRAPNEALFVRLEDARAVYEAKQRALEEYERGISPS